MRGDIHTEPDATSLIAWLQNTENHKYNWDAPGFQEFVRKAVEILEKGES
jgi:hypothetical protein